MQAMRGVAAGADGLPHCVIDVASLALVCELRLAQCVTFSVNCGHNMWRMQYGELLKLCGSSRSISVLREARTAGAADTAFSVLSLHAAARLTSAAHAVLEAAVDKRDPIGDQHVPHVESTCVMFARGGW